MLKELKALAEKTVRMPGTRISEIVLKTGQYQTMKAWYEAVLGVKAFFENNPPPQKDVPLTGTRATSVRLCFIRLHADFPYTQMLAIFDVPGLAAPDERVPGLHHMQFRHPSLTALFDRYEAMREAGVRPFRCANHGPGTSFYFKDPDGNVVELSSANFETEAEYHAFMRSPAFQANPSGIDVNGDEYVARFRSGTPQRELVRIPETSMT